MHERGIGVILDCDVPMGQRVKQIDRFTFGWTAHFALAYTILAFEKLGKWLPRAVTHRSVTHSH
jgi:hypothetical protein